MRIDRHKKIVLIISLIMVILSLMSIWRLKKESSNRKTKVLLIGLDGAGWNIIQPLIELNKLPNIKRLMDEGCWGNLKTHHPMISEVIWTTIATGKVPKKHGIVSQIIDDPYTNKSTPVTSNIRKVKALWNILSEHQRVVGVIGYLLTWPIEEINGLMISDRAFRASYSSKGYSYPSFMQICNQDEFERFKKNIKKSTVEKIISQIKGIFPNFFWDFYTKDNFVSEFSNYLISKLNFNLFTFYLVGIDRLSHRFWKYIEPNEYDITEDEIKRYGNIIKEYYVYCDQIIGDLIKKVDEDTVVIIVSDHGSKAAVNEKSHFFIGLKPFLEMVNFGDIQENFVKIIITDASLEERMYSGDKIVTKISSDILSEEEFVMTKNKIKDFLSRVTIEETGQHLFRSVQDTTDGFQIRTYFGPSSDHNAVINNQRFKVSNFLKECNDPNSGTHSDPGIIIMTGKYIRQGIIEGATVYDITPTILFLVGLPVAKDMDGQVLTQSIKQDFLKKYPIRYTHSYETGEEKRDQRPIPSPMDEEIKERLRSLGYIN